MLWDCAHICIGSIGSRIEKYRKVISRAESSTERRFYERNEPARRARINHRQHRYTIETHASMRAWWCGVFGAFLRTRVARSHIMRFMISFRASRKRCDAYAI